MNLLRHLPNAMTCGNLLCGCLGIMQVFRGELTTASWLILLAAALDFGDGFVARLVNAQSPIGKELDSLADCVTFGVLPAFIVYALFPDTAPVWLPYVALFLAVFSALRLAKFNVDTRQSDSFIGVPTPANGLVVASFPFILQNPALADFIQNSLFLTLYSLLMSYLLVAELPLFALKFKSFGWAENRIKYIFLLLSVLLLLFLQFAAVPLVIVLYIVLSIVGKEKGEERRKGGKEERE